MDKLKKTAKILDKVLQVIFWIMMVGVGMVIIASVAAGIAMAAGKKMDMYSSTISIANVEFHLKQSILMDGKEVILVLGVMVAFVIIAALVLGCVIHILRKIFKPMKDGAPFAGTVSANIRKLGHVFIVGSFFLQWGENAMLRYTEACLRQVVTESVANISVTYDLVNAGMIFVGILLFMLSYIFRYGEELQQQADETL